jgi:hypothetical protein
MPPISDDDPIRDLEKKLAHIQTQTIDPTLIKKHDASEKPLHLPKKNPYGGVSFAFTILGCGFIGYVAEMYILPYGFLIGLGVGFTVALWDVKNSI